LNGPPSLPRRRPPRAAAHEIVWWTTGHAPESMARHIHSTALRHPARSTRTPRQRIGPVPHLLHEHPVWLGQAGLAWRGTVAHATIVPACCHLSLYIVTICRWGLCSRSPQSTSQGAAVGAGTHKGGMPYTMARGRQAGLSVGMEHARGRSSGSGRAEGTQLNGRPFPATVWAEGGQLNGPPSLPRRRPPRATVTEKVWWTTGHASTREAHSAGSGTDALPYACRLLWRRHPARVPDHQTAALVWA
jgi:hypothetical protein